LHFLTQFIKFHELYLLFTISSILSSKKEYLDFLTVLLKSFQFSRLCVWQYLSSKWWQSLFHQALECCVILTVFKYSNYIFSILKARYWTISSSDLASWIDVVFMFLITWMRSSINCFSSSLPLTSDHRLFGILSSWMGISMVIGCHMQVHLSRNNIPVVKPPPNRTSPPSMTATFLATRFMAVLQISGYSVIAQGCGQTLGLGLVNRNRTVVYY